MPPLVFNNAGILRSGDSKVQTKLPKAEEAVHGKPETRREVKTQLSNRNPILREGTLPGRADRTPLSPHPHPSLPVVPPLPGLSITIRTRKG